MRHVAAVVLLAATTLVVPGNVFAEDSYEEFPGCGTVVNRNTSHQFGQFNWVEYIVETVGVVDICGQWVVGVNASVVGVSNSALWRQGILYASAVRQLPVPYYGTWQTRGEHYTSGSIPNPFCCGGWWPTGTTTSFAQVKLEEPEPDPSYDCMLQNGYWDGFRCYPQNSPIIVDVNRNGYHLTNAADGVLFDLDADGTPELVAWTRIDSDDAFLAMDRNGNGRIDDGTELFGNHTPASPLHPGLTTANGFEALAFLGSPWYGASLPDEQMDSRDAAYSRLMLWRDVNHNGLSEPGELTPVTDSGIAMISTRYTDHRRIDRFGNEFRQKGRLMWADGTAAPVYDVWLRTSR